MITTLMMTLMLMLMLMLGARQVWAIGEFGECLLSDQAPLDDETKVKSSADRPTHACHETPGSGDDAASQATRHLDLRPCSMFPQPIVIAEHPLMRRSTSCRSMARADASHRIKDLPPQACLLLMPFTSVIPSPETDTQGMSDCFTCLPQITTGVLGPGAGCGGGDPGEGAEGSQRAAPDALLRADGPHEADRPTGHRREAQDPGAYRDFPDLHAGIGLFASRRGVGRLHERHVWVWHHKWLGGAGWHVT
jgi:hypothetical protein